MHQIACLPWSGRQARTACSASKDCLLSKQGLLAQQARSLLFAHQEQ